MARKSVLSPQQWVEVGKRLFEGETPEELAREFTANGCKVHPATIRSHFARSGQNTKSIQQVASQLFEAEQSQRAAQRTLQMLPAAGQVMALTLAQRMRNIAEKIGEMAEVSASTSFGLASLANSELQKIDDAEPLKKSKERLNGVIALQKAANEAAEVPKALVVAAVNRDAMKRFTEDSLPRAGEGEITPERMREGVRRLAFLLHKVAAEEEEA